MSEVGKKRGRERIYDAQKTRGSILDAAEELFAEQGFDATSMDAIAQGAGYNKSLLFQYFGDKLGLYTQILKRADQAMGELVARVFAPLLEDATIVSDASRFRMFLQATIEMFFDYMLEHPHFMRLLNWEQAAGWKNFTRILSQFEPEDLRRFEALFSQARHAGLLRADLDLVILLVLIEQICWSTPAALPLYQVVLAGRNFSSPEVLASVREQMIAFLVAGIMGDSGTNQ